jgi:23S rRNA pseudouridine2457 synthase
MSTTAFQYYIINKPYDVICQFTPDIEGQVALGNLYDLPKDVYPVGRLDLDSEGLLLLTNDKSLTHKLLNPQFEHKRTYLAQVEGLPKASAIAKLQAGVSIKINKKPCPTLPAKVELLATPPDIADRKPPIRVRQNIPTTWLKLTLTEGKNRQVRKMCAAVGYPCLRLIRVSIEDLALGDLGIGEIRELEREVVYTELQII